MRTITMDSSSYILSYGDLGGYILAGYSILWCGTKDNTNLIVRLSKPNQGVSIYRLVDIYSIPKYSNNRLISHNEATSEVGSFRGVTWQKQGWLKALRIGSIHGINVGGSCTTGLNNIPIDVGKVCTMGYDIEVSQKLAMNGSFPPLNSRITSLAIWCTCSYTHAWTTIKHSATETITYCASTYKLIMAFVAAVEKHMPVWLVGYNCYAFDNAVMAYHVNFSGIDNNHTFRQLTSGAKSASTYSYYIDIVGVNNMDLYLYLDKCLRHKYNALGLGSVAASHGIGSKLEMPTTEDEKSVYDLIYYNTNDSFLTSKLWYDTGVIVQLLSLCIASCSPLVDCIRYVSGTMASCAVSSFSLSIGYIMDWSSCDLRIGYEGGVVLTPIRRLFKNVTVVDFSSMYPTIIRDIGISIENVNILSDCSATHPDKLVWFNDRCTIVCIKGKIIRYAKEGNFVSRRVLDHIVAARTRCKHSNPELALGYKLVSNSLYGAFGFASSPMHSPRAAATVTMLGRIALMLASTIYTGLGLTVTYGDTDSCMLAEGKYTSTYFSGDVDAHITFALDIFHRIIKYTPFPRMRMERDKQHKAILLVDKKHYAYMDHEGKVYTKGLSSTRKDRIGICRDMTKAVSELILSSNNIEDVRPTISKLFNIVFASIHSGSLNMHMVSKEVRYEGNTCYKYAHVSGEEVITPVARSNDTVTVEYDRIKVYKALEDDMNKICGPAGLGTVRSMIEDADPF